MTIIVIVWKSLINTIIFIHFINFFQILTLNGRGGGVERPPIRFFLSHFLCVKDKEPKLRDFLSLGMTHNWELEFFEYLHPGGHRMPANLAGSSR